MLASLGSGMIYTQTVITDGDGGGDDDYRDGFDSGSPELELSASVRPKLFSDLVNAYL